MKFLRRAAWLVASSVLLMGTPLFAADLAALEAAFVIAPFPSVTAFAEARKLSLTGVELAADGAVASLGDAIVALITLREGDRRRQWLVQLTTVALTAKEQRQIEQLKGKTEGTIFTSTGTEVKFDAALHAMEARTIGPFFEGSVSDSEVSTEAPKEKRTRTVVMGGFLGLGLDRYCDGFLKLRRHAAKMNGQRGGFEFKAAPTPFSAEVVAKNQPRAAVLGLNPADERGLIGGVLALSSFFDVAQKTPGLQDILSELLDKKSLAWSMLTHGGKLKSGFKPGDPEDVGPVDITAWEPTMASARRCGFILSLNGQPSLATKLIVTAPRPPLLNCAGIIGMTVEPLTDKTKSLVIRVISARSASRPSDIPVAKPP